MEELLEMITLKQLGKLLVPIIILNTNGFFDPLLKLFRQMIEQRFMRDIHSNIWTVISEPSKILEAINNAPEWDGSAIKYAPA
jgi:predicted Rossmann-fold nucleotide-binding protein